MLLKANPFPCDHHFDLEWQKEASGEIDDTFPEPLKEPILRKVQFQQINRIDYIGEHNLSMMGNDG